MVQRRIFLDANVIIESFRISVWTELSNGHYLETVEMCEREALTGQTTSDDRVTVDSATLRAGLKASHIVSRQERNKLTSAHRACMTMDPGEKDLFAHLFASHALLPPLIVLSSADKGVIVRAKDLGWLEHLISLEELLQGCGVARAKLACLDRQYSASFLSEKRTQVMLGIIP
jgi:hypothetical protein